MVVSYDESEEESLNYLFNNKLTYLIKFTYLYLLIRFKLKYRQVSIITHTDFDGAISAAIILQKYPYSRLYFTSSKSLHKVLYIVNREQIASIPHDLYILDLSIADQFYTRLIKAIQKIRRTTLVEVYWIDHHRSKYLHEIGEFVVPIINSTVPHAAYLVYEEVNNDKEAEKFINILERADLPFVEYWGAVLNLALKSARRRDLRENVVRALAKFERNEITDDLYHKSQSREKNDIQPKSAEKIYVTGRGYKFTLIEFREGELYAKVREVIRQYQLDFLIVSFSDGTFSAYKSRHSVVDLSVLFYLVGGKGHVYAFHFDPQMRISDEFFTPLNVPDLLLKVQEVL